MKELSERMLGKMSSDITGLKEGLDPENIAFWYKKVIAEAERDGTAVATRQNWCQARPDTVYEI